MSSVKKGTLARASEWAQHLRPWGRRIFWKRERVAQAAAIVADLDPDSEPPEADSDSFVRWAMRYQDRSR